MQSIKFKSNKTIKIGDDIYKPYLVGNLPPRFGFKSQPNGDGDVKDGISEWFNYKGLTYIKAEDKWYDAL
jgi:hypothetical protein